ncbi:MAG: alpha/beta fold hydrolase [Candidatus Uhrbacteria bacterium]|nr:alpha/beta fold hydrolase [Patescibacteria group bacterium]MBU1907417.1 alpha/beta fold hydrolase [Patescibacteria group bacterium]
MRIILIHGFNANPEMNFHPWLRDELQKEGFEVLAPALPFSGEPVLADWLKAMEEQVGRLDPDDIILGHSLGGVMALRYLEAAEMTGTPRAVVLVAAPWNLKKNAMQSFFTHELDADVLMWKANDFIIVHSKDDDKVPFDHAEKYAKMLKGKLLTREGEDHYMAEQYPVLLKIVQRLAEKDYSIDPGEGLPDDYED